MFRFNKLHKPGLYRARIHKIAAEFGVGTGTVQRIKAELEEAR